MDTINKQKKVKKIKEEERKGRNKMWHKTKRQATTISQSSLAKWFNKVSTQNTATHNSLHSIPHRDTHCCLQLNEILFIGS